MKLMSKTMWGILFLFGVLAVAPAMAQTDGAIQPARSLGFQQVLAADPGRPAVAVDIWYPTNTPPGLVRVGAHAVRAAPNAPLAGTGLVLIVISHGTGGGPMSHLDTAIALAEAGFVVAAPTHNGDNFRDDSAVGRPQWLADRSRHLGRTVDFMLNRWRDAARLDGNRVGLFGFSAGATTGLIALGGVPDLGRIATHCAAHPEFVCSLVPSQAAAPGPAPSRWTHDRRIAAAVLAAPGLGFTFEPAGLSNVRAPVQLWAGAEDQSVPYETNAGLVRRLLPRPPDLHRVPGAGHFSFLMPCGQLNIPLLCQDGAGFDRIAFHVEFNRSVTAFFRRHLGAAARGGRSPAAQH